MRANMSAPEPTSPTTTPPQANIGTAIPAQARPGNYFVRHWRGQLSLPVSYWVNGTLLTLVLAGALTATQNSDLAHSLGRQPTGLVILSSFLLTIGCAIWQGVGIWRSAEKHPSRGGSSGWATAAKVMVVLGVIRLGAYTVPRVPVIADGLFLALGYDRVPPLQLHVISHGSQVEVSGGIPYGSTDALKSVLDATPGIWLVRLNSLGGRLAEADQLGQLISARGLATYTTQKCVSACVLAFMGGKERYLGPNGKLGFHEASLPGLAGRRGDKVATERFQRLLLQRGLPSSFVDRALAPPATSVWYPSSQELFEAHVITRVVGEAEFSGKTAP